MTPSRAGPGGWWSGSINRNLDKPKCRPKLWQLKATKQTLHPSSDFAGYDPNGTSAFN